MIFLWLHLHHQVFTYVILWPNITQDNTTAILCLIKITFKLFYCLAVFYILASMKINSLTTTKAAEEEQRFGLNFFFKCQVYFLISSSKSWLICILHLFRLMWHDCWREHTKKPIQEINLKVLSMCFPIIQVILSLDWAFVLQLQASTSAFP